MTKVAKRYKQYCKNRYHAILLVYGFKTLVELKFVDFAFTGVWLILGLISILLYLAARWYQLRHTKFRKKGFKKRRKR